MRRSSVRVRLTLLYGGLFLAMSSILLVGMNLLLRENLHRQGAGTPGIRLVGDAAGGSAGAPPLSPAPGSGLSPRIHPPPSDRASASHPDIEALSHLVLAYQWIVAGILVAVFTLLSIVASWCLVGRVLRPLRHITETARRLSLPTLHERIALAGRSDELAELADTFDTMLDRLERAVDSQRRFIANAAHELRTPLAIQRAAIEIGLDQPSPARLARIRGELLEINRRNERLIDGLLLLAQGEHGLEATEPVPLDLVVQQAVGEVTATDGIAIHQLVEPFLIEGDAVLLHRLVANLVHNAVRYNRPGGTVEIHLTAAGRLTVRNTGAEIAESSIDQLFEPFRRLNRARTGSTDSAGLGLSIVASIARAHDAAIAARPNPGGGLELTVQFPAARAVVYSAGTSRRSSS